MIISSNTCLFSGCSFPEHEGEHSDISESKRTKFNYIDIQIENTPTEDGKAIISSIKDLVVPIGDPLNYQAVCLICAAAVAGIAPTSAIKSCANGNDWKHYDSQHDKSPRS